MTKIFQLVKHDEYVIIEYEVIRETPKYWFAQMRNVRNKEAMDLTFKIKKDSPRYFYSPTEAIQSFIENQERKISDAQRDIRNSESKIERMKNELQI